MFEGMFTLDGALCQCSSGLLLSLLVEMMVTALIQSLHQGLETYKWEAAELG